MSIIKRFKMSKYHILATVLPLTLLVVAVKFAFNFFGLEPMPKELASFFPSVLTGIIFLLGFILAGVVTDFKESEKIPNEIASSIYVIWQEAGIIHKSSGSESAKKLLLKIRSFIPSLKKEFFAGRNRTIFDVINSFSDDFAALDAQGVPPGFTLRMRNEQLNLRKFISRIIVIRETDFAPSLYATVRLIVILFLMIYFLLRIEPFWGGMLIVWFFTFVLFSIMYMIRDMEDPFEYSDGDARPDEISLAVLDQLQEEVEKYISV